MYYQIEDDHMNNNELMFIFQYFLQSTKMILDIKDDQIVFLTGSDVQLHPTEIAEFDFILHTKTEFLPSIKTTEQLNILVAPHLFHQPELVIEGLSIYNLSGDTLVIPSGTLLFSLSFTNIQKVLALPFSKTDILHQSSFNKNVLNFTFIEILSNLIGNLGERQFYNDIKTKHLSEKRRRNNKVQNNTTPAFHTATENLSKQTGSNCILCAPPVQQSQDQRLPDPAKQTIMNPSVLSKRDLKKQRKLQNISQLDPQQEQKALNAVFLL